MNADRRGFFRTTCDFCVARLDETQWRRRFPFVKFVRFVADTGVCGATRTLPFYLLAAAILLPLAVVGRRARIV